MVNVLKYIKDFNNILKDFQESNSTESSREIHNGVVMYKLVPYNKLSVEQRYLLHGRNTLKPPDVLLITVDRISFPNDPQLGDSFLYTVNINPIVIKDNEIYYTVDDIDEVLGDGIYCSSTDLKELYKWLNKLPGDTVITDNGRKYFKY
jgi:hypothetical protein